MKLSDMPFKRLLLRISRLDSIVKHYPFPNQHVGVLSLGDGFVLHTGFVYKLIYNGETLARFESNSPEYDAIREAITNCKDNLLDQALNAL